jgi:putative cofactor-binding repeat protein
MIRKIFALTTIVLLAGVLFAQDKTVTITGNLIDNACAESAKDLGARAKNHSTSCAMMDGCEKSGYAVYASDNKLYKLDDKGNESAADLLKNTKTKNGVKVSVEGTLDGDTIKVTKLTEVTAAIN